ncbi:MAG TPA: hypothetical protein DCS43_04450 [Verrucomicrobia bacterium]|nr:hypothetical protein [Verrucomicrobiota bacterium]
MTRLSAQHKRDLAALLAQPARLKDLKAALALYMPKTPYRVMSSFMTAMKADNLLHEMTLKAESGHSSVLYASTPPELWSAPHVAQVLFPEGYFCNLTSLYYHKLSNQVPTNLYIATEPPREKDQARRTGVTLSDQAIFRAFVQPHRTSNNIYRFGDSDITHTERINRDQIGIVTIQDSRHALPKGARVTCIERAIIDAVVQPHYNGGITAVIDALRLGLPRAKRDTIMDIYKKLSFVYPYWQSLGFLSERLGAPDLADAIRKDLTVKNKFYLDHLAKTSWAFDTKWQVFYPEGIL